MRIPFVSVLLVASCWLTASQHVFGRVWTSSSGTYELEAEAISFNESLVVLKKTNGDLIAVELAELSQADQEYVRSKEAQDNERKSAEEMQTWTARDGMKVRGRVLAYGRKALNIRRQRGAVYVNDTEFNQLDPLHQKLVLRILTSLVGTELTSEKELTEWAKTLGGKLKSFPLEGVLLRLESGDEIGVPFFLFAEEELAILKPGWELWLEREESEASRERESFLMRSAAMAYQRDRRVDRQIELLKLDLLAASSGVIGIWQVGLAPRPGMFGRPVTVMVPAQNSDIATRMALSKYPGYVLVGVRRASR